MQLLSGVDDLPRTANIRTQLVALAITAVSLVLLGAAYAAFPAFWPRCPPDCRPMRWRSSTANTLRQSGFRQ
jgi:hypothetical protein